MESVESGAGRRIYIHTYSLCALARQDRPMALWVTQVLARIRAARIVQHHLIDQASHLGILSADISLKIHSFCSPAWAAELTQLLRAVGYRPSVPRDRSAFLRVLDQEEEAVMSCYDQGYYTFATSESAAERMFSDVEPISQLAASLKAGTGPKDLVLIRGQCLTTVDPDIGVGRVGKHYANLITRSQVKADELMDIDEDMRSRAIAQAKSYLEEIAAGLRDPTQRRLISDCIHSATVSLTDRSSLGLPIVGGRARWPCRDGEVMAWRGITAVSMPRSRRPRLAAGWP